METGTLKQLNVKPGDVVECLTAAGCFTVGDEYICYDEGHINDDHGDTWPLEHSGFYPQSTFRIISRATPTPELTAITTPFGLLDEATQEALRAHGGPYEYWYEGEWHDSEQPLNLSCWAWRAKPGPIIETETMKITNADGMHMVYATVTTYNGTPNWATLQVKLND